MNIETLEMTIVGFIVFVQFWMFFKTNKQISVFKNIIPETSKISVSTVAADEYEENSLQELSVPDELRDYINPQSEAIIKENYVSRINTTEENEYFEKILDGINKYLERNRSGTTDFNLIKDITERNADAIEEEINLTISIPLYLGLMGTMLGIIIGLMSMSSLTLAGKPGEDALGQGIDVLLSGVKIAMFASLFGLSLTTFNSGWFFKGSKRKVDARKNDFYTLIQTELLPVINQSMGSTFESLQRNLFKFNNEFTGNLSKLSGIFEHNFEALKLQESILSKIEKIDVATVAKYNVNVLKELQKSMEEFEQFNAHAANINTSIDNSTVLVERLNDILARTDHFKTIAENIDDRLAESQTLLDFLSRHTQNLEEYRQKTTETIAETGFHINGVFVDLRQHIEESTQEFKNFTAQEINLLQKALSESKTNLGNLEYLKAINSDISQFKDNTASQSERIRVLLNDVSQKLDISIKRIEYIGTSFKRKSIRAYFKDLFNQNGN